MGTFVVTGGAFVRGSAVYVDGGTDVLLPAGDWPAPWLPAT